MAGTDGFEKLRNRELKDHAVRDAYGFEVKAEYLSLHRRYSALWQQEEAERSELWCQLLHQARRGLPGAEASDVDALCHILSHCDAPRGSCQEPSAEGAASLQQLRALVQAGVPMSLRGKFWQLFLRTDAKRKDGLYAELVDRALDQTPFARCYGGGGSSGGLQAELEAGGAGAAADQRHDGWEGGGASKGSGKEGGGLDGVESLGLPVVEVLADCSSRVAEAGAPPGESAAAAARHHTTFTVTSHDILHRALDPGCSVPEAPDCSAAQASQARTLPPSPSRQQEQQESCIPPLSPESGISSDGGGSSGAESTDSWRTKDWLSQVEKDLHRTFPGHPLMDASGRSVLRRILAAYSRHNPAVGYCQGMNFIAACFMLFMGEEDAFWCLAAVVEDLLPGYFDTRMVAPQVDQRVFGHLLQASSPTVMAHLEALEVDAANVSMQWFLCMYVNSLPLETCLRVWDMLFFEGSPMVLLRVGLALVDIFQKALLECRECSDAYMLLQSMGPMSFDSSRLLDTACIGYGHIKDSALRVLRAKYRLPVMEQLRGSFSSDQDFREYAYYHAHAEAPRSRSQAFADAFSGVLAVSGGASGSSSPGAVPADQGHLTPAESSPGSCSPGGSPGGYKDGACTGPQTSFGRRRSSGGRTAQLLPAAKQAMSSLTARLVPSSLPSLLPAGALGPRGEERPPQGVLLPGGLSSGSSRRQERGREGMRTSAAESVAPANAQQEALPVGSEGQRAAGVFLRRLSTARVARAAAGQESPCESHSAATGAELDRGGCHSFSPFSDPAAALASTGSPLGCPSSAYAQAAGASSAWEQSPASLHSVAGPGWEASSTQQQPEQPEGEQAAQRRRPAMSSSPYASRSLDAERRRSLSVLLPEGRSLSPPQRRGRHPHAHQPRRRRSHAPDLLRLAAFVPDFRQPAVAAAFRIASNPSPRHAGLLRAFSDLADRFSPAAAAGSEAWPEAPGEAAEEELDTVRALRFDGHSAGAGAAEACGGGSTALQRLPPRRYTDGDVAELRFHYCESSDREEAACGAVPCSMEPGVAAREAPASSSLGHAADPPSSPAPRAGDCSGAGGFQTPPPAAGAGQQQASPAAPSTSSQLLAVIGRLQEEVATAESRRHAAEVAAKQAADTCAQLGQQLEKLWRDVESKEQLLAELRGKVGAMSNELGEAEGELCAGRMAIDKLQRQVEERQLLVAEQDELIRLLMDRACR